MRTQRSAWRRAAPLAALAALAGSAGLSTPAAAQPEVDLNQMTLRFTQGAWASPLVCEYDGEARRGLRRVRVSAAPPDVIPPSNHLIIYPMGVPDGVRCYLETGETQFDVAGSVTFHREGFSRPDLAPREFQEMLQRDRAFSFTIKSGSLEIAGKRVQFAGGKATFTLVLPGTDAFKRLKDVAAPHKLTLALEAPDGTQLSLDLAMVGPPRAQTGRD